MKANSSRSRQDKTTEARCEDHKKQSRKKKNHQDVTIEGNRATGKKKRDRTRHGKAVLSYPVHQYTFTAALYQSPGGFFRASPAPILRTPRFTACHAQDAPILNPFTTGKPFLGTKLLGFSIGRGSGALLKGSTNTNFGKNKDNKYFSRKF